MRILDENNQFAMFSTPGLPYGFATAVSPDGYLYVSDSLDQIFRYDTSGNGGLFANTGPFSGPIAMDFGPDGYLYVANYRNSTIYRYDQKGNQALFASGPGLAFPSGLAVAPDGTVYVANPNIGIYRFDQTGHGVLFATNGISRPIGLAFDAQGNLYVANSGNNTIYRFTTDGTGNLFARTDATAGRLAFDPSGNLYVTLQSPTHGIERFDPSGSRDLFLDVSRFGFAIDITWVPEPSAGALGLVGLVLIGLHRQVFRHRRGQTSRQILIMRTAQLPPFFARGYEWRARRKPRPLP